MGNKSIPIIVSLQNETIMHSWISNERTVKTFKEQNVCFQKKGEKVYMLRMEEDMQRVIEDDSKNGIFNSTFDEIFHVQLKRPKTNIKLKYIV